MAVFLTIDKVKPGTIIVDNKMSRFLIIGVNKDKNYIDCLDQHFDRISIGLDWIQSYLVYDTIDMLKMLQWMNSYTN